MWTDYRCVKCIHEIVRSYWGLVYKLVPRGTCDGHCRTVPEPHNLNAKAFGIDGEDSRTERDMLGEHKSLLDT